MNVFSDISNLLFSFIFFSLFGWVLEVCYRSIRERRFVNPGLLKGPYLILYGTGALILMGCISLIHEHNIFIKVLCYLLATTGLELISGFNARHLFNVRLWDYSDQRFQFRGHICLKFSIYWVLLALAFEYLVLPPYYTLTNLLSLSVMGIFSAAVFSCMVIDLAIVIKRKQAHFARDHRKRNNL